MSPAGRDIRDATGIVFRKLSAFSRISARRGHRSPRGLAASLFVSHALWPKIKKAPLPSRRGIRTRQQTSEKKTRLSLDIKRPCSWDCRTAAARIRPNKRVDVGGPAPRVAGRLRRDVKNKIRWTSARPPDMSNTELSRGPGGGRRSYSGGFTTHDSTGRVYGMPP